MPAAFFYSRGAACRRFTRRPAVAADLPRWAHGDEQRLRQIVFNLVANAVKFTTTGGVVFSVQRTASGTGVSPVGSAPVAADAIRFSVSDTGPGIPAGERDRLFREHARLSPRPTAGEESNGLGLAIVKHLVESQAGTVGADFSAEGGSTFWFELPAKT